MTPNPDAPKTEAPKIEPKSEPKPKIDFNVSEEDLAKHKKQEEERKALESTEDKDKDTTSPDKDPAPVFAIGGGSDSEDD